MNRLIVHLSEHWPAPASAPWVLLDDSGRVLQQGHSEPRHWPAAEQLDAVLGGSQCTWLESRLPRRTGHDEQRLLHYALEDRLLRDGEHQHLTVARRRKRDDGQKIAVLAIARPSLRQLVAQLAALGRPADRILAELDLLPDAAPWSVSAGADGALLLQLPEGGRLACDASSLSVLLGHALQRAGTAAPTAITWHGGPGTPPPTLSPADGPAVAFRAAAPWQWWTASAAGSNLLHGEFAAPRRAGALTARLGRPLRLAAGALLLAILAHLGELAWLNWQAGQTRNQLDQLFRNALPNVPAVAPTAQLARALDDRRETRGRLRRDDFLALFAAWTRATPAAERALLHSVRYDAGRLELAFSQSLNGNDFPALRRGLALQGLEARWHAGQPNVLHLQAMVGSEQP